MPEVIKNFCKRLEILLIAQHKTEGPSTQLVLLGIELNMRDVTTRGEASEIARRNQELDL